MCNGTTRGAVRQLALLHIACVENGGNPHFRAVIFPPVFEREWTFLKNSIFGQAVEQLSVF